MGAATTSCEDMFTPDNEHVTTDLAPKDTVYQVMGIVGKMQHIVDRTILLGEVRADLVEVPDNADKNLQDLANHVAGLDNAYNDPADYYAVINSCNIYLAHVDSLLKTYGEYKFKNEIITVKTFRAWTYLELAKIYGEVPFILEPIVSANAAEEAVSNKANMKKLPEICDFFIKDLAPYAYEDKNNELRPTYGKGLAEYFIPVRVMLGELCLWRGSFTGDKSNFIDAARYYHNFLTFPDEERANNSNTADWATEDFTMAYSALYSALTFGKNQDETVMYVPMDTAQYFGTFSELKGLFNSLYENDYYPSIVPSVRLREISQGPTYCYARTINNAYVGSAYAPKDINDMTNNNPLLIGDLRLYGVYGTESVNDKYNAALSTNRQVISKHADGVTNPRNLDDIPEDYVTLFRVSTIYLHMAEALNRAGFPETAFAILKYGLAEDILSDRSVICQEEYDGLKQIASYGFAGDFTIWNENVFMSAREGMDRELLTAPSGYMVQRGIHDLGSGYSFVNDYYVIPVDTLGSGRPPYPVETMAGYMSLIFPLPEDATAEDSLKFVADSTAYMADYTQYYSAWYEYYTPTRIAQVDSLILEEMALENSFEGQRYYDLMRYSKYNNTDELAKSVAQRAGKDDNKYAHLRTFLADEKNWYLPLRSR